MISKKKQHVQPNNSNATKTNPSNNRKNYFQVLGDLKDFKNPREGGYNQHLENHLLTPHPH